MKRRMRWFSTLSLREQGMVGVGASLAALWLCYGGVYSPLTSRVSALRAQVFERQTLLQEAHRIQARLLREHRVSREAVPHVMVVVEHSLLAAHLAQYVKGVEQPDAKAVSIALQNVPFDPWIHWLQDFVARYQVVVVALQITPAKVYGRAELRFTLRSF